MSEKEPSKKDDEVSDNNENQETSSIVEKIQQLGQTNIPQAPDSNIHVLTIIGQIDILTLQLVGLSSNRSRKR